MPPSSNSRPHFLNGPGRGRVGWRVFKERSSETRYPKKVLQGSHNTVCSHVTCNDLLSMRYPNIRAEGEKPGMFPSYPWSSILSKLYPLFGGRTEQTPRYLSGFSCSLCTPTQKILSDCLAHEEVLGPSIQRSTAFFKQPGQECEEIRAGSSLSPMGNGHSLVKKEKHVFKIFMSNTKNIICQRQWWPTLVYLHNMKIKIFITSHRLQNITLAYLDTNTYAISLLSFFSILKNKIACWPCIDFTEIWG